MMRFHPSFELRSITFTIVLVTLYLVKFSFSSAPLEPDRNHSPSSEEDIYEKQYDFDAILEMSIWAVNSLIQTSEIEIYNSIRLDHITILSMTDGIFHTNTHLEMDLVSPHFASGESMETYEFLIMEPLSKKDKNIEDTKGRIFAIDRFPEMNSDFVEEAWIQKVEQRRNMRRVTQLRIMQEPLKNFINDNLDIQRRYDFQNKYEKLFRKMNDYSIKLFIETNTNQHEEIRVAKMILQERKDMFELEILSLKQLVDILMNSENPDRIRFAAKRVFDKRITSPNFRFDLFGD